MDSDREVALRIQDGLLFIGFFLYTGSFLLPVTQQNSAEWLSIEMAGWEAFIASFLMIFEIEKEWQLIHFHLLFWSNLVMAGTWIAVFRENIWWMRRLCYLMVGSFAYMFGLYLWLEAFRNEGLLAYGYLVWSSSFLVMAVLLVLKLKKNRHKRY